MIAQTRFAIALATMAIATAALAKVQCSCPKIAADGEGLTSCSASESSGRCTVDFNLFGAEGEQRAAELLRKNGATKIVTLDPQMNTSQVMQAMASARPDSIPGLVLVYLTVALASQDQRFPNTIKYEAIKDLVFVMQSNKLQRLLVDAFDLRAQKQWQQRTDEQLRRDSAFRVERAQGATVAPGCVEFTARDGTWAMFKMPWSPTRIFPRCSPSR